MTTVEFSYQLLSLEEKLYRFALRLTSNKDDAKDLIQETLLKAYTYKSHFEECTNMMAWTFTIMKNIFINNYRRNLRKQTIFDNKNEMFFIDRKGDTDSFSPESVYSAKELNRIIDSLKVEFMDPFRMHIEGFKYDEIAEKLNLKLGTVKSRIFFARKTLIKILSDQN